MRQTLILNQSYEPIAFTEVERAFSLMWVGKADLVEKWEAPLKSPNGEWDRPAVIRLRKGTRFNRHRTVEMTRKNIFRRDGHRCAYCGSHDNLTVDHIIPRSRGGLNRWENVITACHRCNNMKDNKTPEEMGWTLPHKPLRPHYVIFLGHGLRKIHDVWRPYLYV